MRVVFDESFVDRDIIEFWCGVEYYIGRDIRDNFKLVLIRNLIWK